MASIGIQQTGTLGGQRYIQAAPVGTTWLSAALQPGLILSFDYVFWRHDPRPLIVTSRYLPKYGANIAENLVCGFNLHYLPTELVRGLIRTYTQMPGEATSVGLHHPTIKRTYRTYKVKAIGACRRIDWRNFVNRIAVVSKLRPEEREALIASVELQLTRNPRDLTTINRLVSEYVASKQKPVPMTMPPPPQNPPAAV